MNTLPQKAGRAWRCLCGRLFTVDRNADHTSGHSYPLRSMDCRCNARASPSPGRMRVDEHAEMKFEPAFGNSPTGPRSNIGHARFPVATLIKPGSRGCGFRPRRALARASRLVQVAPSSAFGTFPRRAGEGKNGVGPGTFLRCAGAGKDGVGPGTFPRCAGTGRVGFGLPMLC